MKIGMLTGSVAAAPPVFLLAAGILVLGFLVWVFRPGKGLMALVSRVRMNNRRVLLEDALKYLFDCEYRNVSCSLNEIAGNLNISADRAARLMDRLHSMGLTDLDSQGFRLSDAGKSYALRIIRVHRIWERYLADETGVDPVKWHDEADFQEHSISPEDADELAARLGNPVYDPHGDPIPSPGGALPPNRGLLLSDLNRGMVARILHIEDEPSAIFEQLAALGLYPGMQVYVLDVADGKIRFAAEGEECVLTRLFANAVSVERLPDQSPVSVPHRLLSSLDVGEKAVITGITPNCSGQQRRRLMDLGIVPGARVSAELKSASGDPVGYRVMGTTIGIRKMQADMIYVTNEKMNSDDRSA